MLETINEWKDENGKTVNHSLYKLQMRQAMPLEIKEIFSIKRIREWFNRVGVKNSYVSFSGGKDSTVLLDLCFRTLDEMGIDRKELSVVFADTGLEYPEIREFVKTFGDIVTWVKPKMNFKTVLDKYGYPVVSKEQSQFIGQYRNAKSQKTKDTRINGNKWGRGKISEKWKYLLNSTFKISEQCCDKMKKEPCKTYETQTKQNPIIGIMADESALRTQNYVKNGCNAFDAKRIQSRPIIFWKEADIWEYINTHKIKYCPIYDMGFERTGCMFCMFGVHLEKQPNRFQKMQKSHPKQYNYCMQKLGLREILKTLNVPSEWNEQCEKDEYEQLEFNF